MQATASDPIADLADEVRALRTEIRQQTATLTLILEAVRGHGDRLARLERLRLTPVPCEDQ